MASPGPATPALTDAELIAAFKKGSLAAFTALVERHQRSLINFFYHCCWDRQTAEDCAQDVFLKLHVHLHAYEPQAKFTTFLYRVSRNLWIDRLRSRASDPKAVSLETPVSGGEERPLRDRVAARTATPLEILEKEEQEEALKRAIDALPEEQRMVVILAERQGLKYQEIGAILDIPIGTVKSRMHTAVERLRELLEGIG
jgi:RNA polymerase sigma-70 factor, ECF subfamily